VGEESPTPTLRRVQYASAEIAFPRHIIQRQNGRLTSSTVCVISGESSGVPSSISSGGGETANGLATRDLAVIFGGDRKRDSELIGAEEGKSVLAVSTLPLGGESDGTELGGDGRPNSEESKVLET